MKALYDGEVKISCSMSPYYFTYPHEFGPTWTVNRDKVKDLRVASLNIWSSPTFSYGQVLPAATQPPRGVMANYGNVVSWVDVVKLARASGSIRIADSEILPVPDPFTEEKMAAYCIANNNNIPCSSKIYPGSGISEKDGYGLYCCCSGNLIDGHVKSPVSSSCDKIPRTANVTSHP